MAESGVAGASAFKFPSFSVAAAYGPQCRLLYIINRSINIVIVSCESWLGTSYE